MRKILIFVLFSGILGSMAALEVDEQELQSTDTSDIVFINYEGPYDVIQTWEEIRGIGRYLGEEIAAGQTRADYFGKYRMLHIQSAADSALYDADVFLISTLGSVDHIRNIQLILIGYLEAAYGYNYEDARTLARFLVYYNAVFRGNLEYLTTRYIPEVTGTLTVDNAGVDVDYRNWPGKTAIVIPLTDKASKGTLSSLESDELTDETVIEQMQGAEDKELDLRKDMAELKDREIDESQTELEKEAIELIRKEKDIAAEEERLEDEKTALAAEEEALAAEKARIEAEKAEVEKARSDEELSGEEEAALKETEERLAAEEQEIEERDQALEEEKEELEVQETVLEEEKSEAEAEREVIEEKQREQAERIGNLQEEREQIAEDEQSIMDAERSEGVEKVEAVHFLKISDIAGEPLGQILLLNRESGEILEESFLNTIRGRMYNYIDSNVVVLAGREEADGFVRLVLLDQEELDVVREGSTSLYSNSVLVVKGSSIYSVMKDEEGYFLARFDKNLDVLNRSDVQVAPFTTLSFSDDRIFAQDPTGRMLILSEKNLIRINE